MILESWRQARWLRVVIAGVRRWGLVLRVTAAALAALVLLSVAIIGGEEPVGAQEAESAGVGISLSDLSDYPTHLTVDGFMVELTNLSATEEYQVTVSSDSAGLGIGGCGTASQTATVTGVAARELRFLVYACAVGGATVTAEVRRTGADSPEASISQRLMVEAIPENAIGARGERVRAAAGAVPQGGHARERAENLLQRHHLQLGAGELGDAERRRDAADGLRAAVLAGTGLRSRRIAARW